jgi:hypothetical protein
MSDLSLCDKSRTAERTPDAPSVSLAELGLGSGEQASPSPVQAALEEARTTAKLKAANIVTVYDFALSGDTAYVVMEYVDGATLADVLAQLGDEITLDVVAAVVKGVGAALNAAHKQGVLHLDIKPQNVLIDTSGQVKVADFGMSALMDAAGVGHNAGGTVGYMPPEQLRLGELDARSDEWALASLTYEMLVGDNPFKTDNLDQAAFKIEGVELVVPSLCWDDSDPFIDDVIFAALDPRPEARYDTVADFTAELLPMLGAQKAGKAQLAAAVEAIQNNDLYAEGAANNTSLAGAGNVSNAVATSAARIISGAQASIDFAFGEDAEDDYSATCAMPAVSNDEFLDDAQNDAQNGSKNATSPSSKNYFAVLKRVLPVFAVVVMLVNCLLNIHIDALLDVSTVAGAGGAGGVDGEGASAFDSASSAAQGVAANLFGVFGVHDLGLFADLPVLAWVVLLVFAALSVVLPHICGIVSFCALAATSAIDAFFKDPIDAVVLLTWIACAAVIVALARDKTRRAKCIAGGIIGAVILLAGLVVLPCVGVFDAFGVAIPSAQGIVACVLISASLIIVCVA